MSACMKYDALIEIRDMLLATGTYDGSFEVEPSLWLKGYEEMREHQEFRGELPLSRNGEGFLVYGVEIVMEDKCPA